MKAKVLTVKPHGSHRSLPAVQRLHPFLWQVRAARLGLRESHCCGAPSWPPFILPYTGSAPTEPTRGCNLIVVPHSLLPLSQFRFNITACRR